MLSSDHPNVGFGKKTVASHSGTAEVRGAPRRPPNKMFRVCRAPIANSQCFSAEARNSTVFYLTLQLRSKRDRTNCRNADRGAYLVDDTKAGTSFCYLPGKTNQEHTCPRSKAHKWGIGENMHGQPPRVSTPLLATPHFVREKKSRVCTMTATSLRPSNIAATQVTSMSAQDSGTYLGSAKQQQSPTAVS